LCGRSRFIVPEQKRKKALRNVSAAARSPEIALQDAELHADVSTGRAGVGADLVRNVGELTHLFPLQAGDVDDQGDDKAERVALRPMPTCAVTVESPSGVCSRPATSRRAL
jgi:hypothetical protein